jgi:hypothetical protein
MPPILFQRTLSRLFQPSAPILPTCQAIPPKMHSCGIVLETVVPVTQAARRTGDESGRADARRNQNADGAVAPVYERVLTKRG